MSLRLRRPCRSAIAAIPDGGFISLDVLEPPVNLAGAYTLTFTADSACANLPDELRTRTYDATIQLQSVRYPGSANSKSAFEVIPSGSVFSDTFNYFALNVAGNFVSVSLGDHTDPGIAERVAPNTYFAFGGWSTLTVASPVHTITTPFEGWIDHCALKAPVGARYDCSTHNRGDVRPLQFKKTPADVDTTMKTSSRCRLSMGRR